MNGVSALRDPLCVFGIHSLRIQGRRKDEVYPSLSNHSLSNISGSGGKTLVGHWLESKPCTVVIRDLLGVTDVKLHSVEPHEPTTLGLLWVLRELDFKVIISIRHRDL